MEENIEQKQTEPQKEDKIDWLFWGGIILIVPFLILIISVTSNMIKTGLGLKGVILNLIIFIAYTLGISAIAIFMYKRRKDKNENKK